MFNDTKHITFVYDACALYHLFVPEFIPQATELEQLVKNIRRE